MLNLKSEAGPARLCTVNQKLKVATKIVLQNERLVLAAKAAKIALDVKLNRPYDPVIPLLPFLIDAAAPVILDIGANMGQFAARLSREFPDAEIHCFEPLHANVVGLQRVKRWLELKNVTIREEALCDQVGSEALHVPVFTGSYRDGALAVLEGSKRSYDNVRYHIETVRTNTIDACATALGISQLDFIKVDTEGAEERVIQGGLKTIDRFLPTLYLETSLQPPWLASLYGRGYLPFYNDGARLYAPRENEQQINVLFIHRSIVERHGIDGRTALPSHPRIARRVT